MAPDDDTRLPVLPTRTGTPQGAAAERVMLQGADGIRTRVKDNPDGGTTLLRTRGGMPEFKTVSVGSSQVCVLGPFTEMDYLSREWYPKAETELEKTQFDIRTTDGIFLRHLRPLKTMKVRQGTPPAEGASDRRKEMEFWFSRDNGVTPATAPVSTADVKKAIWEYGPRTFYPSVPAQETGITKAGLHYAIKRIETLKLQFPTRQRVTYTFSRMFIEIVAPATHTCTNQAAEEKTLKQRTYFAAPETGDADALEKVKLTVGSRKLVQIECANRGWFLDYIGGPSLTRSSGLLEGVPPTTDDTYLRYGLVEIGNALGSPEAVNLSKVDMFGVMWHGLAFADHILITPDLPREPFDYTPADYAAPDDGSVHYVKSPADLPEPVTPAALDTLGAKFLNYALFFGTDKRYSTTGPFALGASGFIHFDEDNVPYRMSLEVVSYEQAVYQRITGVTVRVVSYGPATVSSIALASPEILGEIYVPIDYVEVGTFSPGYFEGFTTPRVCSSPDGRKATIELIAAATGFNLAYTGYAVEVTIPADKVDVSAALVWHYISHSWPGPEEGVTTTVTFTGQSRTIIGLGPSAGTPPGTDLTQYIDTATFRIDRVTPEYKDYEFKDLALAAYSADTGLLVLVEAVRTKTYGHRESHYSNLSSLLENGLVGGFQDSSLPAPEVPPLPGDWSVNVVTGPRDATTETITSIITATNPPTVDTDVWWDLAGFPLFPIPSVGYYPLAIVESDPVVESFSYEIGGYSNAASDLEAYPPQLVRRGNATSVMSLRDATSGLYVPAAVLCPTSFVLVATSPIYATYHPVTGELSVGDTLRCFV